MVAFAGRKMLAELSFDFTVADTVPRGCFVRVLNMFLRMMTAYLLTMSQESRLGGKDVGG